MKIPKNPNDDNDSGSHCAQIDDNITYDENKIPKYLIWTANIKVGIDKKDAHKEEEVSCSNNIDYDTENIIDLNKEVVATKGTYNDNSNNAVFDSEKNYFLGRGSYIWKGIFI